LSPFDLKADIAEDFLRAIAFRKMLSLYHKLSAWLPYGEIDLDAATGLGQIWRTRLKRCDTLINSDTLTHADGAVASQFLRGLA
jgi:hypothetical protein